MENKKAESVRSLVESVGNSESLTSLVSQLERVAKMGIWELDMETGKVFWTGGLYHMLGFDQSKPPPDFENHSQLFKPSSWESLKAAVDQTRKTGKSYELELELSEKIQSPAAWMLARGNAVFSDSGAVSCVRGVAIDITERKIQQRRYQAIFGAAPTAFLVTDVSGKIEFANSGAEKLFGFSSNALSRKTIQSILTEEASRQLAGYLERCTAKNSAPLRDIRGELYALRKDGFRVPIGLSLSCIEGKSSPEIIVAVTDLTIPHADELEKAELQDQLFHSQKLESLGRLAAGISHDFNNNLTIILGSADMLLRGKTGQGEMKRCLDDIVHAGEHSAKLTQALLGFARKQIADPRTVDVNDTISGFSSILKRIIGEYIELRVTPGETVSNIYCDPGQLEQIIINLCTNSREAIVGEGYIDISTENFEADNEFVAAHDDIEPGFFVKITISDNGTGIDSIVKESIFEPFFTTKGVQGTGLGLSTVFGIMKQNHGAIEVHSTPGEGTSVNLYFPVKRSSKEEPVATNPVRKYQSEFRGKSVLLVEDDVDICRVISIMLKKAGFAVTAIVDPLKAITIVEGSPDLFDIVITDLVMPGISGVEMINDMVAVKPDLKAIYISGYNRDTLKAHGIYEHSHSLLTKPFTQEQLQNKLVSILSDSASDSAE